MHRRCESKAPFDQRLASPHEHWHTLYLAKLKQRARIARRGRNLAIPEYRGHGIDLERSEPERKQDCLGVVDARVSVDDDSLQFV
jgi:hypothetical protein